MREKGILAVISGFSGAGKGTLLRHLTETYDNYALSVSATSRAPREGEQEGVSYFFKTREQFEKMIEEGELIEHACYVGNYYGTPRAFVEETLAKGRDVLLEIEIQGAMQIKKSYPEALLLFITAPSVRILKERLYGRGTESPAQIEDRMRTACKEAQGMDRYDFILVNDDIEECVKRLHYTIQGAKSAVYRQRDLITDFRKGLSEYAGRNI